jgi:alpha-ketoglutarate-dependent taurine dioxygenase
MKLLHTIRADNGKDSLAEFVAAGRQALRALLHKHGALLLRGFQVDGIDGFETAVRAMSGEPLPYEERSSPRSTIKDRIYTSTDYPPAEEIFLHNENSYRSTWPMTLYFYCMEPPDERGATPLSDTRQVLVTLDAAIRDEFARRRWMAVRNLGLEFGLFWQEVFNTDDRDEIIRFCAANDVRAEWRPDGGLRTTSVRETIHRHPWTGEPVWFNHAAVFHISTLPRDVRDGIREMFDEQGLPSNSYFGDGGVITDDVMLHIRECYRADAVRFDHQRGDVLVIDNMLVAHGREPFTGPRKIAVAMTEPHGAGPDRPGRRDER